MELQKERAEYARLGLELAAISHDPPEITVPFSAEKGIEYPLLSDVGSRVIRLYGLLNTELEPDHERYGIPFPGTLVLDPEGRVVERFFEASYRTRFTGRGLAARIGADPKMAPVLEARAPGDYLSLALSVSDTVLAPGQEFVIRVDVATRPGVHVYAPGNHPYRGFRVMLDGDPRFRAGDPDYPVAVTYHFEPLDETVPAFEGAFRVLQPVVLEASRELSEQSLEPGAEVTLAGQVEYQACDEKVCFVPESVPFRIRLGLKPFEAKVGR